jgi:rSAM/selenodomain-associated transferase 2
LPPTFSIIIPAYSEARRINGLIGHINRQDSVFEKEIIVVDGNPQKTTLAAVKSFEVIKITAPKGRGSQMNAGAAVANGDILLFLHVDTLLPPAAFSQIAAVFYNKQIIGGAFDLKIASKRPALRLIAKAASLRSRLTRLPYGDQAQFIKRTVFEELDGFPKIPIMEDVALMQRIKKAGQRIAIIDKPVTTSPRRWQKEGVIRATLRNWVLISLYLAGVSPKVLTRYYE